MDPHTLAEVLKATFRFKTRMDRVTAIVKKNYDELIDGFKEKASEMTEKMLHTFIMEIPENHVFMKLVKGSKASQTRFLNNIRQGLESPQKPDLQPKEETGLEKKPRSRIPKAEDMLKNRFQGWPSGSSKTTVPQGFYDVERLKDLKKRARKAVETRREELKKKAVPDTPENRPDKMAAMRTDVVALILEKGLARNYKDAQRIADEAIRKELEERKLIAKKGKPVSKLPTAEQLFQKKLQKKKRHWLEEK